MKLNGKEAWNVKQQQQNQIKDVQFDKTLSH